MQNSTREFLFATLFIFDIEKNGSRRPAARKRSSNKWKKNQKWWWNYKIRMLTYKAIIQSQICSEVSAVDHLAASTCIGGSTLVVELIFFRKLDVMYDSVYRFVIRGFFLVVLSFMGIII